MQQYPQSTPSTGLPPANFQPTHFQPNSYSTQSAWPTTVPGGSAYRTPGDVNRHGSIRSTMAQYGGSYGREDGWETDSDDDVDGLTTAFANTTLRPSRAARQAHHARPHVHAAEHRSRSPFIAPAGKSKSHGHHRSEHGHRSGHDTHRDHGYRYRDGHHSRHDRRYDDDDDRHHRRDHDDRHHKRDHDSHYRSSKSTHLPRSDHHHKRETPPVWVHKQPAPPTSTTYAAQPAIQYAMPQQPQAQRQQYAMPQQPQGQQCSAVAPAQGISASSGQMIYVPQPQPQQYSPTSQAIYVPQPQPQAVFQPASAPAAPRGIMKRSNAAPRSPGTQLQFVPPPTGWPGATALHSPMLHTRRGSH